MDGAEDVAIDGKNDRLYIADTKNRRVQVLRASDGQLLNSIGVGGHPYGLAVDGGHTLMVHNRHEDVALYRVADGQQTGRVANTAYTSPRGMAVDWASGYLLLLRHNTVVVFRLPEGEELDSYDLQGAVLDFEVASLAIEPASRTVYLAAPQRPAIQACWYSISEAIGILGGADQLTNPSGIVLDSDRDLLLVADTGNHRLQLWKPSTHQYLDHFGRAGTELGHFRSPYGLALYKAEGPLAAASSDKQRLQDEYYHNALFVADTGNHRIQVLRLNDEAVHVLYQVGSQGTKKGHFQCPQSVALYQQGRYLLITDSGNDRLQLFRLHPHKAAFFCSFGSRGSGSRHFNNPHCVVAGPPASHTAFVSDFGNHRIVMLEFSPRKPSEVRRRLSFGSPGSGLGQLSHPIGLTLGVHLLFIVDQGNRRIQVFDTNTNTFVRHFACAAAPFDAPYALAVEMVVYRPRVFYIVDTNRHRIQVMS